MVADAGWDPLRLADTKTHLMVYREAEVKHGACQRTAHAASATASASAADSAPPHRPPHRPPPAASTTSRPPAASAAAFARRGPCSPPPHSTLRTPRSALHARLSTTAGRLAMLAAAGWPISELVPHGSDSILQSTVRRARQKRPPLAVAAPPQAAAAAPRAASARLGACRLASDARARTWVHACSLGGAPSAAVGARVVPSPIAPFR